MSRNNELIDLHIHTTYSDGEYSSNEVISMAKNKNAKIIAITDHDTVLGLKNITTNVNDIKIIPGVELTCYVKKGRMHMLGYYIDIDNESLNNKLNELKDISFYSALSIINELKKDYNIAFSHKDILEILNSKGNIGRPQIAKLLVKYGYSDSVSDAFNKYLEYIHSKVRGQNKKLSYKEAINLIHEAGGVASLAHPNQLLLDDNKLEILIKDMKESGLDALEVYHSLIPDDLREKYLSLAKKYDLLVSGGSDFHGELCHPEIEIVSGKNNNVNIKNLSITKKKH